MTAEQYKANLIAALPRVMAFLDSAVEGWKPSEAQHLQAIEVAYEVMKLTGDVTLAAKAKQAATLAMMGQ